MGLLRRLKRFLGSVISHMPLAQQAKDALHAAVKKLSELSSAKLHDIFNLFAIGSINIINFVSLARGSGFMALFGSSMVYFIVDLLFIAIHPDSVKSSTAILIHHLISAVYMLVPLHYPQYRGCLSTALLVEINTWLQIARRTIPIPGLNEMFYVSWVTLRLMLYPWLTAWVFSEWWKSGVTFPERDPFLMCATGMQSLLTGLNYYWTVQLLCKVMGGKKKPVRPITSKAKAQLVSHMVNVDARAFPAADDKSA